MAPNLVWRGIEDAAEYFNEENPNYDIEVVHKLANYEWSRTAALTDTYIEKGFDAIAHTTAMGAKEAHPIALKASQNGVIWWSQDTPTLPEDDLIPNYMTDSESAFIGAYTQGAMLADEIGLEPGDDVVISGGPASNAEALVRIYGYVEFCKDYGLDIKDVKPANWDTATIETYTRGWLTQYPDLKVIFAGWGQGAITAASVVKASEKTLGPGGIYVTGYDGVTAEYESIMAGEVWMTTDQLMYIKGWAIVNELIKWKKTGEHPFMWIIRPLIVTQNNVDELYEIKKAIDGEGYSFETVQKFWEHSLVLENYREFLWTPGKLGWKEEANNIGHFRLPHRWIDEPWSPGASEFQ